MEVIYYVASSLDGFIAEADGGIDWLSGFESDSEDYGYAAFIASIDTVIMGRKTFNQVVQFGDWPYKRKRCIVVTGNPQMDMLPPDTFLADDICALEEELRSGGATRVWLVGGGTLAASIRAAGLITEYIISVIPVILGAGIPLFARPVPTGSLRLIETVPYSSGIVQLRYRRA